MTARCLNPLAPPCENRGLPKAGDYREKQAPASARELARRDVMVAVSLVFCLYAVYLLTYRGGFHSIDEVSMFAVTESMVKFGQLNTDQVAWTQWTTSQREAQGFFGPDGHVYSKKGPVLSLAMAPLYWLGLVIPGIGMLQTVSLVNLIVTAATMGLLYLTVRRLGFGEWVALGTALVCGLATIAWVYSKYLFSEPLAGLLLLGAAYLVVAFRQQGAYWRVTLAGVLMGLTVATRANNLFVVPVFALCVGVIGGQGWPAAPLRRQGTTAGAGLSWRNRPPGQGQGCQPPCGIRGLPPARAGWVRHLLSVRTVLSLSFYLIGLMPSALLLGGYNWLRSGNPFHTGYDLTIFSPDVLGGLYKLLFSPLRGLFVYSPVLILSLPGLIWLWRRNRAEAGLIGGIVAVTLLLFAAWASGEGLSWGSRFLVPLVPLLCLSLAPVMERALNRDITVAVLLGALSVVSFIIQVLGVAVNPWVYLARLQVDLGGEFFLERTAALMDFRYTQIVGQLQSWSLTDSDVAWWQPWGFDALALGLSLVLVAVAGYNLARLCARRRSHTAFLAAGIASVVVSLLLLNRYYLTDRQFGQPGDAYSAALDTAAVHAGADDRIVTVAPYHYHVAMNRFRARIPLIGFASSTTLLRTLREGTTVGDDARQGLSLPETALPLLDMALAGRDAWLVTVGFPSAAPDVGVEHWLALNAFKGSEAWIGDSRLVHYATARAATTTAVHATLGTEVRLLSASVPPSARPGGSIPVELVWQPMGSVTDNLNVFVQLLGADGLPVAQHDGPPVGGYAATSTWPPGVAVRDRHALLLPADLRSGDYRLIAGLVDPATGRRLADGQGRDSVDLGVVAVEFERG